MKPRTGRWLDTALRAQQARTLDHQGRVHETQSTHDRAAQQEAQATQDLQSLASSWRRGREAARLTQGLDGLYQRFHAQLHAEAADATQALAARQQALDVAVLHLQQSHALQQALDSTVQRRDRRAAHDRLAQERSSATEAWVLDRAGRKGRP